MSREWKPGDVAVRTPLYSKDGQDRIGFVVSSCNDDLHHDGPHWHYTNGDWNSLACRSKHRPLAVIDPENREQVERLAEAYLRTWRDYADVSASTRMEVGLDMQAALRGFANPKPPKPDEPTGLGAVVEDAGGRRYVRTGSEGWEWYQEGDGPTSWNLIDVARIVSEGAPS